MSVPATETQPLLQGAAQGAASVASRPHVESGNAGTAALNFLGTDPAFVGFQARYFVSLATASTLINGVANATDDGNGEMTVASYLLIFSGIIPLFAYWAHRFISHKLVIPMMVYADLALLGVTVMLILPGGWKLKTFFGVGAFMMMCCAGLAHIWEPEVPEQGRISWGLDVISKVGSRVFGARLTEEEVQTQLDTLQATLRSDYSKLAVYFGSIATAVLLPYQGVNRAFSNDHSSERTDTITEWTACIAFLGMFLCLSAQALLTRTSTKFDSRGQRGLRVVAGLAAAIGLASAFTFGFAHQGQIRSWQDLISSDVISTVLPGLTPAVAVFHSNQDLIKAQ